MNRRRRLAISSEHMECRLVLSPTGLANPRIVLNANDDAAGNDNADIDRPVDDGQSQQRFEQRSRPATKHDTTDAKTKPSDPQSTPSDDRTSSSNADRTPPPENTLPPLHDDRPTDPPPSSTPPPSNSAPPAEPAPTTTNSDTAPAATDPARNDESATTSRTEGTRDSDGGQPSDQTTSPEPERTPATDSTTSTERDVVTAERNEVATPNEPAPTAEPTRQTKTRSADDTSVTPASTQEPNRKETDTRPVVTTDADEPTLDRTAAVPKRTEPTTTMPTKEATRVDDTSLKVRPVETDDRVSTTRTVAGTPVSDATTAVRQISTDATRERNVDDPSTPAVVAGRTETLSRLTPNSDMATVRPSTPTIGEELILYRTDTAITEVNDTITEVVADVDPATKVAAVVVGATTESRLASSINDRVEHVLPVAEPALPSGSVLPKVTFSNAISQIVHVKFASTADATVDRDRALPGELLSSSTDIQQDTIASQTLFADATRLGVMLAAIHHAGRRPGSWLALSDLSEDAKPDSCLLNQERRRRRSFGTRRPPRSPNGSPRRRNALETIDERTTIPASPSYDVLFADAAMMSVLFHEAEQRSSGSSRWNQTTVLGGLAAGTGGLAARRARQLRRRKAANVRPRPPQPRHNGKTLVFAD